ncbi:uncharacterized protein EHS24_001613 [Apiotrichum porosum]|uniref:Major facilitator superfamily (MFS) profile domain-containing protein n=1 Tax=Apiotrichum porosum TaxID=105984 RepID=A0A427XIJ8_9TREE|nr:uncharacterized protein EHS24_001613 [Apiotrichum porosum]RSH78715.1 hypothetical protein EHS24_001613 [Apiotrichum porosum]
MDDKTGVPQDVVVGEDLERHESKDSEVKWNMLIVEATEAEVVEKGMPLWTAIKLYRRGVRWSMAISLCLIMTGFQASLLSVIIALPIFRERYGRYDNKKHGYQLTAQWQTMLGLGASFGEFVGIFIAAWCQDRWGCQRTIQLGLIGITAFVFVVFFAPSVQVLFLGEFLCGMPWGAFSSASFVLISEATIPNHLAVGCCLVGAGVVMGLDGRKDKWAYKWVWPIPIFILVTLAPESPWWLVRRNKLRRAEKSVRRLLSHAHRNDDAVEGIVAMMVRTNQHEKETTKEIRTWDLWKGTNARRTEIASGLSTTESVRINLGLRGLAIVGTVCSWFAFPYIGRRTMFLWGLAINNLCILGVGLLTFAVNTHPAASWGMAGLLCVWTAVYDFSVASTACVIVGEVSSTRLRAKTVSIARNAHNASFLLAGVLNTYMLNATAWNWGSKAGFFWFGTGMCCFVWAFFRLPETKGRSFRELDILFERGVPTREFKNVSIEVTDEA